MDASLDGVISCDLGGGGGGGFAHQIKIAHPLGWHYIVRPFGLHYNRYVSLAL